MKKPVKSPSRYPCEGQDNQDQAGQGNRRNISAAVHRRASIVARTLMKMPPKSPK